MRRSSVCASFDSVSGEELQIVAEAFLPIFGGVDMVSAIDDDALWEPSQGLIDAEAEITFVAPQGGGVGAMGGPFRGIAGMRAGWREWLSPWQSYVIAADDVIDAGGGRVLALVSSRCRMHGSGAEVAQGAAAIVRVESGQIVAAAFYLDQDEARRDAGLD